MSNQKSALFHNTVYYVAVFIVVIASGISLLIGIGSNQPQITMAQQQQQQQQQQLQVNQTSSSVVEEQQQVLEGISFQIDNVTFHIIWHPSMEFRCTM
jgi:hypothetical protein